MRSRIIFVLAILLCAVFVAPFVLAGKPIPTARATITSNGTGGGNWDVGASWTGGTAPSDTDDVTIATGDTITITMNEVCAGVTINNGGTLTMTTHTLDNSGFFDNGNGGTFNAGTGLVNFTDSGSVTTAEDATNRDFYDLVVSGGNVQMASHIFVKNMTYIYGTLGSSSAVKYLYPNYKASIEEPLVLGPSADLTDNELCIYYYAYGNLNIPEITIGRTLTIQMYGATPYNCTINGDLTSNTRDIVMNGRATVLHGIDFNDYNVSCRYFTNSLNELGLKLGNGYFDVDYFQNSPDVESYMLMEGAQINVSTTWNVVSTSDSWDAGTSLVRFDGTGAQTVTHSGREFYNVEVKNTAAAAEVTFGAGELNMNNFVLADGQVDFDTNNPNVNVSGDMTITNGATFVAGSGTWLFDGTTTYTDNSATKLNIGDFTVTGALTIDSNMKMENCTNSGSIDVDGAHTIYYRGSNFDSDNWTTSNITLDMSGGDDQNVSANGSTFTKLIISTASGTTNYVAEDINVTDLEVSTSGTISFTSSTVTVSGDIEITSTVNYGTSSFVMSGTTNQYVNYTDTDDFYNFRVSNSDAGVYLLDDINVSNNFVADAGSSIYLQENLTAENVDSNGASGNGVNISSVSGDRYIFCAIAKRDLDFTDLTNVTLIPEVAEEEEEENETVSSSATPVTSTGNSLWDDEMLWVWLFLILIISGLVIIRLGR